MKMYLFTVTLIIGIAPFIPAAAQGFFVPQKTLDLLQQPNRQPVVRYVRPANNPAPTRPVTPPNTVPVANTPAAPQAAAVPQPSAPANPLPATKNYAPEPQQIPQPQKQPKVLQANSSDSQAEDIKVVPAKDLPTFNYGEVVEPVYNTPEKSPADTTETASAEPIKLTFDDIIKEYKRDIEKISRNQPTDNERLQKVLEKYHDEEKTF
jgi:hypothetical protein